MSATLQSSGLGERQAFELVRKLVELRVLVGLMNASVLWPSALYRRSPLHLVTHILQLRGGYLCADALRALGPAAWCGRPYAGKICEFARMPCCHNLHCNEACQRLLLILQITSSPGIHIQRFISALETRCASPMLLQELRRVRSGIMGEKDNMTTMHDVLDAQASRDVMSLVVWYRCSRILGLWFTCSCTEKGCPGAL